MIIPEIKKILYTTDLSGNARYAAGYAASIANQYGAGITPMHALEQLSPYRESLVVNVIGDAKWYEIMEKNEAEVHEKFRKKLEDFCDEMSAEHPTCPFIVDDFIVKAGNPVELILDEVKKGGYDLKEELRQKKSLCVLSPSNSPGRLASPPPVTVLQEAKSTGGRHAHWETTSY